MELLDVHQQPAAVVGSQVTIDFGDGEPETYRLVDLQSSLPESIPALSTDTPVGRALLGHRAGETISYRAPRGSRELRLVTVS